jgi:hypothetical protein
MQSNGDVTICIGWNRASVITETIKRWIKTLGKGHRLIYEKQK